MSKNRNHLILLRKNAAHGIRALRYLLQLVDNPKKERFAAALLQGAPHQFARVVESIRSKRQIDHFVLGFQSPTTIGVIRQVTAGFLQELSHGLPGGVYSLSVLHYDPIGRPHVHVLIVRRNLPTGLHYSSVPNADMQEQLLWWQKRTNDELGFPSPIRRYYTQPGPGCSAADRSSYYRTCAILVKKITYGKIRSNCEIVSEFLSAGFQTFRRYRRIFLRRGKLRASFAAIFPDHADLEMGLTPKERPAVVLAEQYDSARHIHLKALQQERNRAKFGNRGIPALEPAVYFRSKLNRSKFGEKYTVPAPEYRCGIDPRNIAFHTELRDITGIPLCFTGEGYLDVAEFHHRKQTLTQPHETTNALIAKIGNKNDTDELQLSRTIHPNGSGPTFAAGDNGSPELPRTPGAKGRANEAAVGPFGRPGKTLQGHPIEPAGATKGGVGLASEDSRKLEYTDNIVGGTYLESRRERKISPDELRRIECARRRETPKAAIPLGGGFAHPVPDTSWQTTKPKLADKQQSPVSLEEQESDECDIPLPMQGAVFPAKVIKRRAPKTKYSGMHLSNTPADDFEII